MNLAEPVTVITDCMLAIESFLFAYFLVKGGRSRPQQIWAIAFFFIGIGALLGAAYHGLVAMLDPQVILLMRRLSAYSVGLTSFLVVLATSYLIMNPIGRQRLLIAIGAKLVFYLTWITFDVRFLWVILDYAPALTALVAFEWIYNYRVKGRQRPHIEFTSAWLIAVLGSGIQLSGFTLHQHFNHNDLYHVVQMFGLYFFYLGAKKLPSHIS
jgi:hypothetical protein